MSNLFTGLGPTDLVAIFSTIFSDVMSVRASRGLPPLVSAHLGQEQLATEESPPRIVVVPVSTSYEDARIMGSQPPTGQIDALNPRIFATRWMHFRAHLWGDETPTPSTPPIEQDVWYSFNTTIELEREFLGALMRQLGNVTNPKSGTNVRIGEGRWTQPTNMQRLGRLLVLDFSIGTAVTDEPWTIAVPTSISVDTIASFPDGTNVDQGTFTAP